jgi:redox-sensitive bicupin YhaK (pirin superfamily)
MVVDDDGTRVRVVVGEYQGRRGPVRRDRGEPTTSTFGSGDRRKSLQSGNHATRVRIRVRRNGTFRDASQPQAVTTDRIQPDGSELKDTVGTDRWCSSIAATRSPCMAGPDGIRFLLVSGQKPLKEPVAWQVRS